MDRRNALTLLAVAMAGAPTLAYAKEGMGDAERPTRWKRSPSKLARAQINEHIDLIETIRRDLKAS